MIDIRQSPQYADYLRLEGWIVERINGVNYFIKKFPLVGSILKIQRPSKIRYGEIALLCKKYRVFEVIIEPLDPIKKYKLSKSPYLPTKTLQLDLTKQLSFDKETRRAIRRGERFRIKSYSTPNEIKNWREAWKKSVNFNRYVPSAESLINLHKSFKKSHSLFLASHNISGNIIGGALFTISLHDFGYYWYGFTNSEGRTSLSQYSLLYRGILWAKEQNCKIFDFEGIYDTRFPIKSWLGFTRFKRSFGGQELLYPGCYTRFRIPYP